MPTLICDLGGVLFTEADPQRRPDASASAVAGALNLDVLEVLGGLREKGWRLVGALDAGPSDEQAVTEQFGWALSLFERVVTSQQVGALRPDPRFFAELRGAAGPGPRLYVDDAPHNVSAARRAGFDAHLFTTAPALRSACRQLVVAVG